MCSQFDEIHDVILLEQKFEECQECMLMYINSCHLKKQIKTLFKNITNHNKRDLEAVTRKMDECMNE